jgi:hypothetical protein
LEYIGPENFIDKIAIKYPDYYVSRVLRKHNIRLGKLDEKTIEWLRLKDELIQCQPKTNLVSIAGVKIPLKNNFNKLRGV